MRPRWVPPRPRLKRRDSVHANRTVYLLTFLTMFLFEPCLGQAIQPMDPEEARIVFRLPALQGAEASYGFKEFGNKSYAERAEWNVMNSQWPKAMVYFEALPLRYQYLRTRTVPLTRVIGTWFQGALVGFSVPDRETPKDGHLKWAVARFETEGIASDCVAFRIFLVAPAGTTTRVTRISAASFLPAGIVHSPAPRCARRRSPTASA